MRRGLFVTTVALTAFLLGVGATMATQSGTAKPRATARVTFRVINNNQLLRLPGKVNIVVTSMDGLNFSADSGPRMGGLTNAEGNIQGFADAPVNPRIMPIVKQALQ